MDKHALKALKQSIRKWERNAAGIMPYKLGPRSCPLCVRFNRAWKPGSDGDRDCLGCPIAMAMRAPCCDGTPYDAAAAAAAACDDDPTNMSLQRTFETAAGREVAFLRSLLQPRRGFWTWLLSAFDSAEWYWWVIWTACGFAGAVATAWWVRAR